MSAIPCHVHAACACACLGLRDQSNLPVSGQLHLEPAAAHAGDPHLASHRDTSTRDCRRRGQESRHAMRSQSGTQGTRHSRRVILRRRVQGCRPHEKIQGYPQARMQCTCGGAGLRHGHLNLLRADDGSARKPLIMQGANGAGATVHGRAQTKAAEGRSPTDTEAGGSRVRPRVRRGVEWREA